MAVRQCSISRTCLAFTAATILQVWNIHPIRLIHLTRHHDSFTTHIYFHISRFQHPVANDFGKLTYSYLLTHIHWPDWHNYLSLKVLFW